ncbi:MAG: aspartate 1-decarboxylase [Candidatus Gygaella obscura]|nr:aspartate 1-decarboxylase [Candidatus Gygaella obscura]
MRTMLKSKLKNLKVTETELFYEGSITIDEALMEASDILPGEKVEVLDVNNGARISTYAIKGKRDSGIICMNGPAARLVYKHDIIMVLSYVLLDDDKAKTHEGVAIAVDENNRIKS